MLHHLKAIPALFLPAILGAGSVANGDTAERAIFDHKSIHHPVVGYRGMAVTQEAEATRVAARILESGGNAVDAGVAAGFALAVTLPRAGNIGGGGFMLVYQADSGKTVAYDFRECAPSKVTESLFLDEDGEPSREKSPRKHLGVGVPGSVDGLLLALENHGSLERHEVISPAIGLARKGFVIGEDLAESIRLYRNDLVNSPAAREVFYDDEGPLGVGERLIQRDLANTLQKIAEKGRAGFYEGDTAKAIVRDMEENGGLISLDDLKGYRTIIREPLEVEYRGLRVQTMSPPSAGGVIIAEALNILERFDLTESGPGSALSVHILAEAAKRAYADRGAHLGDPGFVDIPIKKLTSKEYATERSADIDKDRSKPSSEISGGEDLLQNESNETTHFSIADQFGNVVVCTYTLNHSYGSRHMVPGTGILLNNELDDFTARAGVADSFGLVAGKKNLPGPGKRPLSSMSPTIVFKEGKPWLLTGSPGGGRIPTTVLQMIINCVDHRMNVAEATAAPRAHHQWLPDELRLERGFSPDTIPLLKQRGHKVVIGSVMGSTQSIQILDGVFYGAADPRRPGALALGIGMAQ